MGFPGEKVPRVPLIGKRSGNGLTGIDDASAPDGKDAVDALALGQLKRLAHKFDGGIGLHTPFFHKGQTRILRGRLHGIDQSGLHGRPPSVHQKCFFCSVSVDKSFGGFHLCPASEHQFRRIAIRKKLHTTLPLKEKSAPRILSTEQQFHGRSGHQA